MIKYKINILEELKKAGYPQVKIRNEKIVAQCTITKFRNGDTNISVKTIDTLCRLLGRDITEIIDNIK